MLSGALVAESLRVDASLQVPGLTLSRIVRVDAAEAARVDQPPVWTLVEFTAPDAIADQLAAALAEALLVEGGWYANFAVGDDLAVVFSHRVFRYQRGDRTSRAAVEAYAASVGVPPHQMDWG